MTMKEGFKEVERLGCPSDFEQLSLVEGLIDRTCADMGVDEDNYGNVLIAVTEAFNNAIIHGNSLDKNCEVKVVVGATKEQLCFSIIDSGKGFDFSNIADPTAPENIEKESGRGIYLMRHLADEVEYANEGREVNIYFKKND
ncbi:MAG: serine/threonine-protein kinase RsbW [Lentimonas sp.]|jgi:serine/threonine-protein kinase RsbW